MAQQSKHRDIPLTPSPSRHWYLNIWNRHLTQRRKEAKSRQEFHLKVQQKASISDDFEFEKSRCLV